MSNTEADIYINSLEIGDEFEYEWDTYKIKDYDVISIEVEENEFWVELISWGALAEDYEFRQAELKSEIETDKWVLFDKDE